MSRILGDVFQILNGNVGLGTTIPRQRLDINDGHTIVSGNLGIGTTVPNYAVDVVGDVNFTGILRQSGTPYISSQWTTNGTNIYYSSGNVGIQTSIPLYTLDVHGSLRALNLFASNLTVFGDTTILNTISSNTEQMVITNAGTGPALKVTQSGDNSVAEFYDNESGLALMIANNGNIGIGSTTPYNAMDINGNMYINGTITTNNNNISVGSGTVTAATFSGTATQVSQNLTRGTYLTGTNYNGSVATTWAVDADSDNSANKVVVRDASGNFSAGTITASLSGTATKVGQDLVRGAYLTGTNYNGAGTTTWAVDADTAATANKIVARDANRAIYVSSIGINTSNLTKAVTVAGDVHITSTARAQKILIRGTDPVIYPPNYLTTSNQTLLSYPYGNGTYIVTESSSLAETNKAWRMFDGASNTPDVCWATTDQYNANGGTYIGSTSTVIDGNTYYGEWAQIQLPNTTLLSSYELAPRVDNSYYTYRRSPRKWYLAGSINGSLWNLIDSQTSNTWIYPDSKIVDLFVNTKPYNYYRIIVNEVGNYDTPNDNAASFIGALKLYGRTSNDGSMIVYGDMIVNGRTLLNTLSTSNVGIGTNNALYPLHVEGPSYLNGQITTNNNNIYAGSGTVTASTFSGTATQVSEDLVRGSYLTGNNYNGSVATTWAVDADTTATANKVVVRDASGMIYAANIGIGTTSALYAVDVIGDVNFTGILRQSGTPYISSQWTTNGTNIYYSSGNVGINTDQPQNALHVIGDIRASRTIYASNLQIAGSLNILDTTTSNTQQLIIINNGSGPALIAKQTGVNYVAQFYHDDTEVFTIADGGLIGINTATPRAPLDIIGDTILTGNIGFGTTQALARLYLRHFDTGMDDILRVDNTNTNTTSLMVNHNGNVGIGTSTPAYPFHVIGTSYLNGAIYTNNNNINAGSGTVTAATFSGTATQVSQNLTRGTYLTGNNYNGSIATTWAVDADIAATANKVVVRDSSAYMFASGVGIGTATLNSTLHVVGNILTTGTITASNLTVLGDTTILNTISSNTEQMVITNAGTGPALKVTQSGDNSVAEFYDNESGLALMIANNGNIGIGSTTPYNAMDINGNMYINGTITTNNNNINAGSGTVTAATFSGTATQVSQNLTRGTYLTGNNYNGSIATTWAVDADIAATANKVVVRDSSAYMFASGVGIGTATARQLLDVQGGHAIISGNIGIGTTNPRGTLHLYKQSGTEPVSIILENRNESSSTDPVNFIKFRESNGTTIYDSFGIACIFTNPGGNANKLFITATDQDVNPKTTDAKVTFLQSGNVGIGNTSPAYKLHVEGNSLFNGLITTNNNNINAGTGTITAITFSGTATQVSQNLTRGTYLTGSDYNGSVATTWAVDATDVNTANKVVVRDASGNFSAGTITASLTGTATQVSQNLTRGTYLTGANYNGSVATTWAVDATDVNTANKVVVRDASGNFSAGTITASLTGTATQVSQNLTRGTYLTGSDYNGSVATTWAVDATTTSTASKIVARDASAYMFASGVGIGTATARQLLDVQGGHAIVSGNLGIGTTDPTVRLSVGTGPSDVTSTLMFNSGDTATNTDKLYWTFVKNGSRIGHNGGWNVNHYAGQSNTSAAPSNGNFHFFTGGPVYNERLTILNNGNIGIGSTQPAYRLDVAGNAYINGAITTNNNNINAGTGTITAATFLGTATKVSQDLVRGTYLTGTNYNGAGTTTWAVDAATAAIANKVVVRDASSMIYAANVGVGTTSALYAVDVVGDVNFTGILRQSGTPYVSSQWTTSGANIYYSGGNVGIGTNDSLNYSLNVNGDSYLKKVVTSNLVILQEPTSYFQITPVRKVYYIETASESIFNVNVVGIYGGVASNVQCFVNNNLLSYYSSNIKDYDISYTHTTPNNLTTYTITLTVPAVYGSIVDIIVTPQIITETDLSNNLFYQNVYVTDTYFRPYGNNIAYTNGNVGLGTTIVQNTGGGMHIFAPEGPDINGACAQLIVENSATDVGSADEDARIIIKSKQAGESDLIMYNIDDGVISWGKIGWHNNTIYLQSGNTGAVNDDIDVATFTQKICYFPSANVGIGTTNPDVRLLIGANTTRDEVIKVNSQGFAGLILNGDTANTAGEAGGAYIWLRQDAAATTATIALTQIAGENGRGGTLTGSIANALVLSHANNYPIEFGINGQVLMEVDTDASLKFYTTDNIYCGNIGTGAGNDNLYVTGDDILFLESGGGGTANVVRSLTTYNNGSASGANVFINSAGTLFRSTSSMRYKKDVTTLDDSIADRILTCRPIKYKSINPKEVPIDWTYYGFIAEEVALIEPRLVTYDQNNEPDGVQYDRFVPLLLNLIQRQQTRIQILESTVQQLQADYNNLIQTLQNKNILP